jgi:hypothetical protein
VHALYRPPARAWNEQLGALAALCLLLPLLNWMTVGDQLWAQFLRADWESMGVELVALACGGVALLALRRRTQHRPVATTRKTAGGVAAADVSVPASATRAKEAA